MSCRATDIEDLLFQKGHGLFGFSNLPEKVRVVRTIQRAAATLFICELYWGKECREICVKEFRDSSELDVASLYNFQGQLEPIIQRFEVFTPRFLGYDNQYSLIFMEFIPGETLESKIVRSFWRGNSSAEICFSALRVTAAGLASFHRIEAPNSAILPYPKSNRSYISTFEKASQLPLVRACFPRKCRDVICMLENLSPQFWERHERRLVLGDFQPKNILVSSTGKVCFIDISYGLGHPLLNVSHFLTQLTRMRQRWLLPKAARMIRAYQEFFLEHYFRQGFSYLQQDLLFFRLWSVVFSLIEQAHHNRLLRLCIQRFYRKEISRILPTYLPPLDSQG